MEGRDIGTIVAPHADVKVYLSADAGVRARRRQAERPDIGGDALVTDLRRRDERDAPRLQPAPDAVLIDTTDLHVDDVVSRIEQLVQQPGDVPPQGAMHHLGAVALARAHHKRALEEIRIRVSWEELPLLHRQEQRVSARWLDLVSF